MFTYDQNSRYRDCDNTDNLPQSNLLKDTYEYDTVTVLASEAGRLDLVSYRVYNTPVKWWIIARFNSIINQEEIQSGAILKIPKLV